MQKISVVTFITQNLTLEELKELYANSMKIIDGAANPSEKFILLQQKLNDAIISGNVYYNTLRGRSHMTIPALCDFIIKSLAEYCYRNC